VNQDRVVIGVSGMHGDGLDDCYGWLRAPRRQQAAQDRLWSAS
jgi:hypothetical protein